MNETRLIETFLDLAHISSPSRKERNIADYIKNYLKDLPIEIREDETNKMIGGDCGNLIIKISGDGKPILFSAHMDTVNPCATQNPVVRDGVIYSDGKSVLGSDDKAGIAILLELIVSICEKPYQHAPIVVIFSVCEENSLQGAKYLSIHEYEDVQYAYVLDGEGRPGSVVSQTPHGCKGCLEVTGKEAHAGVNPEEGINALVVAADAISELKIGRIDADTTCNIGVVCGGVATNVVMGHVRMEFEARSYNQTKLEQLILQVNKVFEESCFNLGAIYQNNIRYGTSGYFILEDDESLIHIKQACKEVGLIFHLERCGGASDASIYRMNGINAFNLGIGMKEVHSCTEHIAIKDIIDSFCLIQTLAKR